MHHSHSNAINVLDICFQLRGDSFEMLKERTPQQDADENILIVS